MTVTIEGIGDMFVTNFPIYGTLNHPNRTKMQFTMHGRYLGAYVDSDYDIVEIIDAPDHCCEEVAENG